MCDVTMGDIYGAIIHRLGLELIFFFLNDTAPPEIYTLPLHDALPIYRNRRDPLDRHFRFPPRHPHPPPRRQLHRPRHVRRPQVKLRPIPLEKRRVPAPLVLRQHVHFTLKLRVRRDALRLRQHHPSLHVVLLHAPPEEAHVVPRPPLLQPLPAHLHPRHHHLLVRPKPAHLHSSLHLHLPPVRP